MSELNELRRDRVIAWCSLNGWKDIQIVNDKWCAINPSTSRLEQVPSIAYKPPFPGDIPKGS